MCWPPCSPSDTAQANDGTGSHLCVARLDAAHQPESTHPRGDGGIRLLIAIVVTALALSSTANADQFTGHRVGNQQWQYRWQVWLPKKWQRIGACETGYGRPPGNWKWNSGIYQGAFGFHHSSWDRFKPVAWWPNEAYLATPWQQYQVALRIYHRYGFTGWGCRNA